MDYQQGGNTFERNSREEEKLSFKEQILRDLERLKREDGIANTKSSNDDLFSNLSKSSEAEKAAEEPSVEDLMAKFCFSGG